MTALPNHRSQPKRVENPRSLVPCSKRSVLLLLVLTTLPAFAQEVVDPFKESDGSVEKQVPNLIRVQVEYVEMSHKDLTRLMMEEKAVNADATELRMEVQAMVDRDEAKVIDTQITAGRSGQRQTSDSNHESIYPDEYQPPSMDSIQKNMETGGAFPLVFGDPTAFEIHNLGSSLECEPTVLDGNPAVDLRINSEFAWHTGNTVWSELKDGAGNIIRIAMPDFFKVAIHTRITCIAGKSIMVGVLSPKNAQGEIDQDRKVIVFVKCDVLEAR
jgi:hypothetical protein